MEKPFELTFWGGVTLKYTRNHASLETAEKEAKRVLGTISDRNAHPAIIYGPQLGKDGRTIN